MRIEALRPAQDEVGQLRVGRLALGVPALGGELRNALAQGGECVGLGLRHSPNHAVMARSVQRLSSRGPRRTAAARLYENSGYRQVRTSSARFLRIPDIVASNPTDIRSDDGL